MANYGRRRESIADIEEQISDIFTNHPEAHFNDSDIPVIPAHALPDVIAELSSRYNVEVLSKDEQQQVAAFVRDNPGIEVTPELLLRFVAEATARHNETRLSDNSSPERNDSDHSRGRDEVWSRNSRTRSRSSSRDSLGTQSLWRREPHSSTGRGPDSPFEAKSRQRSAPLSGPPSSWTPRPAPAHRRRSDAGSISDSESPSTFTRAGPRTRAPSTPSSPATYSPESQSPPLPGRPHSRARSHSNFSIDYGVRRFGAQSPHSPYGDEDVVDNTGSSPERDDNYRSTSNVDDMVESISSLPMPANHDSDSDGDGEGDGDETHRIFSMDHERSIASSIASLAPHERLDALQKNNQDLVRRLMDAERTLQSRLADHEVEIEEMQSKLDELKSELTYTKREEKELRNKERQNHQQIQILESELAKLQKTLDSSRTLYQNLHKQYIEQCNESEKLRNSLRQKDLDIKNLDEAGQMHQLELLKWNQQREALEAAHSITEQDLAVARQAQAELEDQKQENLVLKETIDRLRFDLDELRTRENAIPGGPSSTSSQFGSVSKSLGAELMNRWEALQDEDEDEDETEEERGSGSDREEMIQTIITRKKRRGGNGKRPAIERSETREYADAYTQHDMTEFVRDTAAQTVPDFKPVLNSLSIQTDSEIVVPTRSRVIQTEPEAKRSLVSMEIQTDPDSGSAITQRLDGEHASRSFTLKSPSKTLLPTDEPPSYDQALSHQALVKALEGPTSDHSQVREPLRYELKIAEATLKQWHKGVNMPLEPLPDGISIEALEHWAQLKKELGAECMVIDKILAASKKVDNPTEKPKKVQRRRFYNIYNTYFYNKSDSALSTIAAPVFVGFVVSTVMFLTLSPTPYHVPGMPSYHDRAYWVAFNTLDAAGEGFGRGSSGAIWSAIGRLLLGGAEVVGRVNMPS